MRDIIDALHWWRTGLERRTAASVVLNVRVIELLASRVGEASWTSYLEKYAKNSWIRSAVFDSLSYALQEALHLHVSEEHRERQRSIFLTTTDSKDGEQRFHIGRATAHLDEILGFVPADLPVARDLRTLKRKTANASAMRRWCADLETAWGGWVHRLERVRNAVAHGGPFTEQAVELVQPFSQKLSVWMLWECVDGYLDGKSVLQTHLDAKTRLDNWRMTVSRLTSTADIFNS